MQCNNCGADVPENSLACEKCGNLLTNEKINAATNVGMEQEGIMKAPEFSSKERAELNAKTPEKAPKKSNTLIIVLIAIIAVAGIGAFAFQTILSPKVDELYGYMAASGKYYETEAKKIVDENPLFKKTNDLFKNSFSLTLGGQGTEFTLKDDKTSKVMDMTVITQQMPVEFKGFITDDKIIVGAKDIMMLETNPTDFVDDLSTVLTNMGMATPETDEVLESLRATEFSYTNLHSQKMTEEDKLLFEKYGVSMLKKLADKSEYKSGKGTIKIGDEDKECKVLSVIFNKDVFVSWLEQDVLKTYEEDTVLKEKFSKMPGEGGVNLYDNLASELKKVIEEMKAEKDNSPAYLNFYVVDGIIVSVSMNEDGKMDDPTFKISATGKDVRLNDIQMMGKDENDVVSELSIKGTLVGPVFTADITSVNGGTTTKASIVADSTKTENNVTITANDVPVSFTYAVDGEAINISNEMLGMYGKIMPIETGYMAALPGAGETTPLKELTQQVLMSKFLPILMGGSQ